MTRFWAVAAPAAAFAFMSLVAPDTAAEETSDAPAVHVVRPRSDSGVVLGGVMMVGGGIGVIGGGALAIVGAALAGQDCSFPTGDARSHCEDLRGDGPGMRAAGLVSIAVGAALAVGGVYLALRSTHADVVPARPREDAFVRLPAWSRGDAAVAAGPVGAFTPIASGTF